MRTSTTLLAAGLLVHLFSTPSESASIESVTPAIFAGNSDDYISEEFFPREQIGSYLSLILDEPGEVATRYAQIVANHEEGGHGESVDTTSAHAHYGVRFQVDAQANEDWALTIESYWEGALTIVQAGDGWGTSGVGQFTWEVESNGATSWDGSLALSDQTVSNANDRGSTLDQPLDGWSAGTLSGTGPASVILTFGWRAWSLSQRRDITGDEAAVRLGLPTSGPDPISAGSYPGIGDRDATADGHFVRILLENATPTKQVSWGTIKRFYHEDH